MYKYMMKTLGKITMSLHFQRKLNALCNRRDIATIKRWWQTTDGVILPILLTVEDPDKVYGDIDKLIKFSLENCANNYAHFISRMKTLRRLLRKDYAVDGEEGRSLTDVATYWKMFKKHHPTDGANPHGTVQYILCWAQTRATGLADSKMIKLSLDKCERTLSTPRRIPWMSTPKTREYSFREEPCDVPVLPREILRDISWRVSDRLRGETAHISAGPNACLESTRQGGGQSGAIMRLTRANHLHTLYDFRTLEREFIEPRPVRSQTDLVNWSIQETLEHPTYVRCVRLHAVAEPSKARTITVCSLPYLTIVGVMAKLLQPAIASDITRSGLRASRNLWKFLFEDLDPNLGVWGKLRDAEPKSEPILGLSSDLSEATDYGDLAVARQILDRILSSCSEIPGFPTGLGLLAKTLFIGERYCLRHHDGKGYRYFVKRNGWLMGDRLTKVILTLAHEIVVISSGLHAVRICGDDVIAFSRDRKTLEKYFEEVQRLGFQVSWEDSYISSKLAFYCEEGCIPPQKFLELPSVACRRQTQSMYIDYPRIRLLIPTHVETHAYSYTDVGRFALLGKETRWVYQSRQAKTLALFTRAGLLQHLSVPEPSDVMCPYLPIEIGGDGAFPASSTLLKECVLWKSRNLPETLFRMKQLLTNKWGYRFVRNSNLNDTTHKYHVLVPKLEELRGLLPEESIVEGNALLLGSIKVDGLEAPEKTFFRLLRAHYWDTIFRTGRPPPELKLEASRRHDGATDDINLTDVEFRRFHTTWGDTGFTFMDTPDYRVDTRFVHVKDYMNMGWWFGRPPIRGPRTSLSDIGGRKLLNEENIENFIDHIKTDASLDPKVKENLYKYVEADSYILYESSRKWRAGTPPRIVILVSGDKKLAVHLARVLVGCQPEEHREDLIPSLVCMVHPMHYLYGMMEPYEAWVRQRSPQMEVVVDFGAVSFAAFTSSGVGMWYDDPAVYPVDLYRGQGPSEIYALELRIDESSTPVRELVSLTTQPGSQIRPGAIEITRPRSSTT
jgi:hypothetical protein